MRSAYLCQNSHVCSLLLHNVAVPAGAHQMETFTKLSFTPHQASSQWQNSFVMSGRKKMSEMQILQQYFHEYLKLHKHFD